MEQAGGAPGVVPAVIHNEALIVPAGCGSLPGALSAPRAAATAGLACALQVAPLQAETGV